MKILIIMIMVIVLIPSISGELIVTESSGGSTSQYPIVAPDVISNGTTYSNQTDYWGGYYYTLFDNYLDWMVGDGTEYPWFDTINTSWIYSPHTDSGIDMTGDPWYFDGVDYEFDGNVTCSNLDVGNISSSGTVCDSTGCILWSNNSGEITTDSNVSIIVPSDSNMNLRLQTEVNFNTCLQFREGAYSLGFDICNEALRNHLQFSNGTGTVHMQIHRGTGLVNISRNQLVERDVNVIGNFTGNQIYGEMYNYSGSAVPWTFGIADAGTYYNLTNMSAGDLNGFTFTEGGANGGSYLTAQVAGLYLVNFGISFSAETAGGLYGIGVTHNWDVSKHRECYSRSDAKITVGHVGVTCLMDLLVGDNIVAQIENENAVRDIYIHTINLNAVRVGT